MPAVVITRPLEQSRPLAAALAAAGREVVVFPLLDILPLSDPSALRAALARLESHALVAFVSPNAIDAALALRPDWPPAVPIAVMGEGSRAALARHGITDATHCILRPRDVARTDSQTLLETLDPGALRGRRVLIVRGESGRELLADALRAEGVLVEQVSAYRRMPPPFDAARLDRLRVLAEAGCDWVITSSEALRILLDMARAAMNEVGVVKMQQQSLVVPHARIVETARALGFRRIMQSASGDEGLLAALQSRP